MSRPCTEAGRHSTVTGPKVISGSKIYDFNRSWLFGGEYVAGAEDPDFDDGAFVEVTLPHTVTALSWGDWDPTAWQSIWIYRKRLRLSACRSMCNVSERPARLISASSAARELRTQPDLAVGARRASARRFDQPVRA